MKANSLCNPEAKIVILVTSNAPNVEARRAQRNAYAAQFLWEEFKAQRFFLVAQSSNEGTMQNILHESDSLVGDFQESYKRLYLKNLLGLTWAVSNCPGAEMIVKMDDDIAVDFPRLIRHAEKDRGSLAGWLHSKMEARRKSSKWAVDRSEFGADIYPDFVSGWAYVLSIDAAQKIIEAATLAASHLWIDDVWITGILRASANITDIVVWNQWYTPYTEHLKCCIERPGYVCDFIVAPANAANSLIEEFGALSRHCYHSPCRRNETIRANCKVANPYFLPDSKGVGHVMDAG